MQLLGITTSGFVLASTVYAATDRKLVGFLETRESTNTPMMCYCTPQRDGGCKNYGETCSRNSQCCSKNCNSGADFCDN
ncbi:hypothetical protein LX32DRAFT_253951 [Colletotrichum zoysiae]|uniref:Uncharacterized protein n=1 Tax=Colletotrichum zoysiae TaxID=1216348 RepID=A0AAD9HW52_9PEZI|nr:hypothetical protein LX32DRAFT_253951 [Colletotrichum zoysiae]